MAVALHIEALVARCVYDAGSSKPQLLSQAMKALKPATAAVSSGFFSSLFSSFASPSQPSTPQPMSKPLPEEKRKDPMEFVKSSVVLHVFSAEVDVRLDKKMIAELQRSTKKNPPTRLRYDLIYVCARISMSLKQYSRFLSRQGSRNMMQARLRMTNSSNLRVVSFKA